MGKVFLIRHGEVEWNRQNAYVGATDIPLNSRGLSQAERIADRLNCEGIAAVYSSDLIRARRTAECTADRLGLTVNALSALREIDYGEWEGVPEADVPMRWPEVFAAWRADPSGIRIPGGETFAELRDRAFSAFCRIAEEHTYENVAVVAHKCVNRVILCCVLGLDISNYRRIDQGNAALNVIFRAKDGRMTVETVNERCHLPENTPGSIVGRAT